MYATWCDTMRNHATFSERLWEKSCENSPHWPEFLFVYQQLIPLPSHVDDSDAWVGFETATEFGYEYLKAAGVEEVVVTPDFKKERSCVEGLSFAGT